MQFSQDSVENQQKAFGVLSSLILVVTPCRKSYSYIFIIFKVQNADSETESTPWKSDVLIIRTCLRPTPYFYLYF